jgi:type II secretory pathway pseudopilin PulG
MNKKAFTILESASVLLIIALIVGLVIIGSGLSAAAKIRAIIREKETYQSAIDNFFVAYSEIPGDMANATSFFTGTSNGNGDRIVQYATQEKYLIWQHLNLAGMLTRTFNGSSQIPASSVGQNVWIYMSNSTNVYNIYSVGSSYNQLIYSTGCCGWGSARTISPIDAYSIDMKIDDGNATTGNMFAFVEDTTYDCVKDSNGTGATIGLNYTGTDGNYNLQQSEPYCFLGFVTATQ